MVRAGLLPHLPLMLAGVPRPLARLLRAIGLPLVDFPKVPLAAAGLTQFGLFDAASTKAAARLRGAEKQGVVAIDLRTLERAVPGGLAIWTEDHPAIPDDERHETALLLIAQLKTSLEAAGGLWLRVAELPYPYRCACCLGIDAGAGELAPAFELARQQQLPVTIFATPVSRPLNLTQDLGSQSPHVPPIDWGWSIAPPGQGAAARPASRWSRHAARWEAAGSPIRGLWLTTPNAVPPSAETLDHLALTYLIRSTAIGGIGQIHWGKQPARDPVQFMSTATRDIHPQAVPRRETSSWIIPGDESHLFRRIDSAHVLKTEEPRSKEQKPAFQGLFRRSEGEFWWRRQYHAGCALLLVDALDDVRRGTWDGVQELVQRSPLMWTPTFAQLARWSQARGATRLEVWRRDEGYEIHLLENFAQPLSLELWRGHHVALLPASAPTLFVRDDGVMYHSSPALSPAGLAIPRPGPAIPFPEKGPPARQSMVSGT